MGKQRHKYKHVVWLIGVFFHNCKIFGFTAISMSYFAEIQLRVGSLGRALEKT